jgi:hypothetical protein
LKVFHLNGEARWRMGNVAAWQKVKVGTRFGPGALIATPAGKSDLDIATRNWLVVRIYADSEVLVKNVPEEPVGKAAGDHVDLELRRGSIFVRTDYKKLPRGTCTVSCTNCVVRVVNGDVRFFDNGHVSTANDPASVMIPGKIGAITIPARCILDPATGEFGTY